MRNSGEGLRILLKLQLDAPTLKANAESVLWKLQLRRRALDPQRQAFAHAREIGLSYRICLLFAWMMAAVMGGSLCEDGGLGSCGSPGLIESSDRLFPQNELKYAASARKVPYSDLPDPRLPLLTRRQIRKWKRHRPLLPDCNKPFTLIRM